MPIELNDADRKAAEEFIRGFENLDVSWRLDANGWVRTEDVLIYGSISCSPTQVLFAFDTENPTDERPHRMKKVRLEQIGEYYRERCSLSREAWDAVWWAEYNTPNHDPELRRLLFKILNLPEPAD